MAGSLHKLTYWAIPGKAEPSRLALHMTGANWEDNVVTGATWGPMKAALLPTVPELNIPLLEVDGKNLTEAKAILRYVGTLGDGKLIPSSALDQARMDGALSLSEDIFSAFAPTIFGSFPDEASKMEARAAICAADGKLFKCMEKFNAYVASFNGNFVCGEQITVADLMLFCNFNLLVCGMFDGFSLKFLESFPAIEAYRVKVGTLPEVASRYAGETEGPLATGFKF